MSENNLKIRGKFINKLTSKIEDLNNNFILLSKVDKKILKKINNQISENINNQKGGAPNAANNAILAALKKSLEMKKQQQSLTDSLEQLKSIQKVIDSFNNTFGSIKKIIDDIQLGTFPIVDNLDSFVASDINTLTPDEISALTKYLNDLTKKPTTLTELQSDIKVGDFKKKIDNVGFKILFGDRPAAAATDDDDSDEEQVDKRRLDQTWNRVKDGVTAKKNAANKAFFDTAQAVLAKNAKVAALPPAAPDAAAPDAAVADAPAVAAAAAAAADAAGEDDDEQVAPALGRPIQGRGDGWDGL
jgi:hypothetical protein